MDVIRTILLIGASLLGLLSPTSAAVFQVEDVPGWLTEIDVCEIGGKAKGFERKHNMNLHVFRTPQEKKHWSVGGVWEAPWRFADDYHVFGLDWGKDEIRYYVDGVLVRSVENTHWHQPSVWSSTQKPCRNGSGCRTTRTCLRRSASSTWSLEAARLK